MSQGESIAHLEESTIQPIPLTERHGSAKDLFTIWFGSNIMMLTTVTGSLATTVFKQPFWWAALATLTGSLIGGIIAGLLMDRMSPYLVLLPSFVLGTVFTIMIGYSPDFSFWSVLAIVACSGFFMGVGGNGAVRGSSGCCLCALVRTG